jgi:protein-tyrosine-phosphatase
MPAVLFVCTANRFRSPIAAASFQKKLRDEGIEGWQVGSAGTWTDPGLPPAREAVQTARQLGVSLDGHATCLVNAALLSGYDLILVMEMGHKEALESEFPAVQNRVFLLSEVVDNMLYDIPNPALSAESSPQEIANEVCNLVWKGFRSICSQAERLGRARNSTKST